jgi:hypothetical protein
MRINTWIVVALAIVFGPTRSWGQVPVQRTAAALAVADGVVYLNDTVVESSSVPSALPDNAVLRTMAGRAAIALKRGGWLFLENESSVRVLGNGVYNFNRIEVLRGSAILISGTSAPLVECDSEIRLSDAGMFRFDVQGVSATGERSCRFRVFEGAAAVPLVSVTNALRAGQMMTCNRRCGDMVPTMEFSREQLDDFDRWARRTQERLRN